MAFTSFKDQIHSHIAFFSILQDLQLIGFIGVVSRANLVLYFRHHL